MAKVRSVLNDLCGEEIIVADLYRTGKKKKCYMTKKTDSQATELLAVPKGSGKYT